MNDELVGRIVNAIFVARPAYRHEAADKMMHVLFTSEDLQAFLTEGKKDMSARISFQNLHENNDPDFARQVELALSRPGSSVIIIGERSNKNDDSWQVLYCVAYEFRE